MTTCSSRWIAQRRSQILVSEHTAEAMEALATARVCQEEAKRIYDQKASEIAEDETNLEKTTKDAFEKAEAPLRCT